jgi:nucleoside-diphosphate-sugar epimerase
MAVRDYDHRIINVANGVEVTIRNVVESFADSMGIDRSVIVFNGHSRPGDPNNWKADISRLKELGYEQRISIEEGIGAYCRWISSEEKMSG